MTNKLSDVIEQAGENFQPDAMADFDSRMKSGEFANLTPEQIRDRYHQEAIEQERLEEELQAIHDEDERAEAADDQGD